LARFVTFEDAQGFARGQARLTARMLIEVLGANPVAAESFLRRLEDEGLIGPAEPNGEHRVLDGRTTRRSWSGAAGAAGSNRGTRLAELEAEIARLRLQAGESAEWRQRALNAEARLAAGAASGGGHSGRIAALRRMLAKELHPDAALVEGPDRAVHAEIFKTLWPRIEALLCDAPGSGGHLPEP
jgi:hypothetical protein